MESGVKESGIAVPTGTGGCLRNIFCFSAIFSLVTLFTDTLKPYTISQITALEKQFGLSSTRSGLLVSCDQIGYLSAILFFSHCGRSRHIPRLLAGALVLYGIAGISTGLSNLADPVTLPQTAVDLDFSNLLTQEGKLCQNISNRTDDMCLSVDENGKDFQSSRKMVFVLLVTTMVVHGVGKSPVISLGLPFVDNNSRDKPQSSLLTGIISTISFFGWTVALFVGGVLSNIPVDLSDTNLDRLHSEWIGAWWIGYLIFGGMSLLLAIPVIMFPKHIKNQPNGDRLQKPASFIEEVKDMHKSILRVISNPAVTLLLLSECSLVFFIGGGVTFIPKYLESQFRVPAYMVNIIVGTQFFLWSVTGVLAGGILTSKLKLTNRGCVTLMTIFLTVGLVIYSISLGLGCENQFIKGVGESRLNMTTSTLCQCDEEFFPVCGSDSVMYSSPCTAGCRSQNGSTYLDCSEIPGGEATAGWCERDCPYLIPYVAMDLVSGTLMSITYIPVTMTLMKLVEPRDKPMVIALTSFLNSILGYLSGPILYGSIIDTTCSLWQTTCGSVGACALYDLPQLRYRLKGMDIGFILLASCGYFLTFLLFKYEIVSDKTPE